MSNVERNPNCPMRTSLGNCDAGGGFCTSVKSEVCNALHNAYQVAFLNGQKFERERWKGEPMSDLINRKELWKAFTTKFDCVCGLGEVKKTIDSVPAEEPTIDTIAERISDTTWYHINRNGKLVEGASGREEALYKAEDIFRILEEMGASDI